jgi:hypothetical protein
MLVTLAIIADIAFVIAMICLIKMNKRQGKNK